MCAALPAHVLPVNQPKVGLVDEGTHLQGVPGLLMSQVVVRQAVQLLINQWRQFFECRLVTIAPGDEQLRDLFRRARWHTDFRAAPVYQLSFSAGYFPSERKIPRSAERFRSPF